MEYKITKNRQAIPRVYLEWIDGCEVEAVRLDSGEVYYLSMDYKLQEAGYKRIDTGKVLTVDYCGKSKLVGLYKLEKVI